VLGKERESKSLYQRSDARGSNLRIFELRPGSFWVFSLRRNTPIAFRKGIPSSKKEKKGR